MPHGRQTHRAQERQGSMTQTKHTRLLSRINPSVVPHMCWADAPHANTYRASGGDGTLPTRSGAMGTSVGSKLVTWFGSSVGICCRVCA